MLKVIARLKHKHMFLVGTSIAAATAITVSGFAVFTLGFFEPSSWYDPLDPTNPRRGDTQYGQRFKSMLPFRWNKPTVNPRLNPKSKLSGSLTRHEIRGRERWVQIWDITIQDWRDSHVDHVYPGNAVIVPDQKYRYMPSAPPESRRGDGQSHGGLNPYEEDGVTPKWHPPIVDPINNPWR